MNTIEHDGKTYEVLTDWSSNTTHAQLATGIQNVEQGVFGVLINGLLYTRRQINDNNIQPLRLVPKEPVTFEAEAFVNGAGDRFIRIPWDIKNGKRFRCVEIVEEA